MPTGEELHGREAGVLSHPEAGATVYFGTLPSYTTSSPTSTTISFECCAAMMADGPQLSCCGWEACPTAAAITASTPPAAVSLDGGEDSASAPLGAGSSAVTSTTVEGGGGGLPLMDYLARLGGGAADEPEDGSSSITCADGRAATAATTGGAYESATITAGEPGLTSCVGQDAGADEGGLGGGGESLSIELAHASSPGPPQVMTSTESFIPGSLNTVRRSRGVRWLVCLSVFLAAACAVPVRMQADAVSDESESGAMPAWMLTDAVSGEADSWAMTARMQTDAVSDSCASPTSLQMDGVSSSVREETPPLDSPLTQLDETPPAATLQTPVATSGAAATRWYEQYVRLLRRLRSGRAPVLLDLFCGGGCASEGARRVGGGSVGFDDVPRPHYAARFGKSWFELGDVLDREKLRWAVRKHSPVAAWAFFGEGTASAQLEAARATLLESGLPFVLVREGDDEGGLVNSQLLCSEWFELPIGRSCRVESGGGFQLSVDAAVRESTAASGGPERFAVGTAGDSVRLQISSIPTGDEVFGLDAGLLAAPGASRYPPIFASYVYGQLAMWAAKQGYGVPSIAFDERCSRPAPAARTLSHWLRGAGGASPHLGMQLVSARNGDTSGDDRRGVRPSAGEGHRSSVHGLPVVSGQTLPCDGGDLAALSVGQRVTYVAGGVERGAVISHVDFSGAEHPGDEGYTVVLDGGGGVERSTTRSRLRPAEAATRSNFAEASWALSESDFREVDLSHAGDFEQIALAQGRCDWLPELRPRRVLSPSEAADASSWLDVSSFVHVAGADLWPLLPAMSDALSVEGGGARIVVAVDDDDEALRDAVSKAGFERLCTFREHETRAVDGDGAECRLRCDLHVYAAGRRVCARGRWLDHEAIRDAFDVRDVGGSAGPKGRKAAIAWTPLEREPSRWDRDDLPPRVRDAMVNGIAIQPCGDPLVGETAQYPFESCEHLARAVAECDRAMVAGHLEVVPDDEAEWCLSHGHVHPWTVVQQGDDKWRACQDYSVGTNVGTLRIPFTLPRVSDVGSVVSVDSHFAKYDLRDGFWCTTVRPECRHHLMVRHPASGQLLRCTSLPFGYALSPFHFCEITEGVAQLFRQRVAAAGGGCYCYVFVDDFLLVGDTEALTRSGMALFEQLLSELGLPWAPHKQRGPARAIEFLGQLLVNVEGCRVVSLTAGRQRRLLRQIDEWSAREPARGARAHAAPRELASFLGHLVFCSEVIPGGRAYMQAMLRQFRGLEVDWQRGTVRRVRCSWGRMELSQGFWRDLHWWRSALGGRANCVPLTAETVGELALVGSDASDFACGELVWIDGQREETRLVFTHAERRRPINFRELRGCLRALEIFGSRLRGRTMLVELDNTCAYEVARRYYSKAEDLQELVRRLLDRAGRYGITLRPVHTPGAMLDRPDQTSRGDAPEVPRQRLRREVFEQLSRRFGPFTEYLGAEREHAVSSPRSASETRDCLWLHPSFATVGSALRLVGERLVTDPSSCPCGVIVVPDDPQAAWWRLTRFLRPVGRWWRGACVLEENRLGLWADISAARSMVIFSFPATAGAPSLRLLDAVALGLPESAVRLEAAAAAAAAAGLQVGHLAISADAPLPAGSVLYSPPYPLVVEDVESMGCVYLTLGAYSGSGPVPCAHLHDGGTAAAAARRWQAGGVALQFSRARDGSSLELVHGAGASVAERGWLPDLSSLWIVTHLCERVGAAPTDVDGRGSRWRFDLRRAHDEIARGRSTWPSESASSVAALQAAATALTAADVVGDPDDARRPLSGYAAGRRAGGAEGGDGAGSEAGVAAEPAAPFLASPTAGGAVTGAVTPSPRPRQAARHLRTPGACEEGLVPIRCAYAGTRCAGCHHRIGEGAFMVTVGARVVHNNVGCVHRARAALRALEPRRRQGQPLVLSDELLRDAELASSGAAPAPPGGAADGASGEGAAQAIASAAAVVCEACVVGGDAPAPAGASGPVPRTGSDQRRAQLRAQLSDARIAQVERCLEGQCGVSDEKPMVCRNAVAGCPFTLHGSRCCQLASGFVALGCFTCPGCTLHEMMPRTVSSSSLWRSAPATAVRQALEQMLLEMCTGAEATGASFADFIGLELKWVASLGCLQDEVVLPRDSAGSLKMFLLWLVTEKQRALSLDSVWRAAGSVMERTRPTNLTKQGDVKAFYLNLRELHGEESHPRTAATSLMIYFLFAVVLTPSRVRTSPPLLKRRRLLYALEVMCGFRVGETAGGGDGHGLLANHVCVLRNLSTGATSVEAMIEHSKTKFKRYVNAVGTSQGKGQVPLAAVLQDYWSAWGFSVSTWTEGGYEVTGVDYFVLRVSMLGLTEETAGHLFRVLSRSDDAGVRAHAKVSAAKGMQRLRAAGSMDKRYVNVIGGPRGSPSLAAAAADLSRAGFADQYRLVPGPLLRATEGSLLTHMPISPSSTYDALHADLDAAHSLANAAGPDTELDLQGLAAPRWGHHSHRRAGDTAARRSMEQTGATEQDIDLFFGWMEEMYSHKMQVHYESTFDRERRTRVTMMI